MVSSSVVAFDIMKGYDQNNSAHLVSNRPTFPKPIPTYIYIYASMCVCILVAQLCLSLCDPMDCSPPGSLVHGIFQARVLEWGAIAFVHKSTSARIATLRFVF